MALNLTATVSGVEAASVHELLRHWWQWLLFGVGIASLVTGTSYIAFLLCRKLWRMWSRKSEPSDALPIIVSNHLEKYITSRSQLSLEKPENSKPTSLAVYLGGLQNPATADQIQLFESHDMIILDPLQLNVVTFVANASRTLQRCNHITGRLDLAAVCNTPSGKEITKKSIISSLDQILNTILTRFKNLDGSSNGFTGILLAGWEIFPVAIVHELSSALAVLGLDVYLETSGPDFLQDPSTLVSDSIVGLVMRNALLLPNGERQDCFRMEKLRMTVKAFVSQACLRSFIVLSWDTLDNGVVPPPSILKRTYAWCSFYNAIPWIGSTDALFDVATDVVKFEPLSAFDWLKQPHVMELHKNWATSKLVESPASCKPANNQLRALLPSLQNICNTSSCDHHSLSEKSIVGPKPAPTEKSEWFILDEDAMGDPFNLSSVGKTYDGIGCFPLGVDVTEDDFQEIVWSQRNLKKLDLLDAIPSSTLREYGTAFHDFVANDPIWKDAQKRASLCSQESVLELATTLTDSRYEVSEGVRVFLSLNSGFQRASGKQFWAVYHVHASSVTDIFVSKDAEDLTATIMHTYLSSLGFTRRECLATELAFAHWRGDLVLPHAITRRMDQDFSLLSPDECVLFLQRISLASNTISDGLIGGLKSAVRAQLIDDPTVGQLKALNAASYLSGRTSVEDLVASRIRWHCHCSRTHPETASAVRLFLDIEAQILQALKNRSSGELQRFTDALDSLLSQPHIDAISDIVALAGFCTMRKLAFEEIYVEVTDRNPLFNNQSDQAAAFAELFALGSRCEAYFDITPSRFGELLSEKFLDFYGKDENQPPPYEESSFALRSAYAEAQIDVDPKHKDTEMPAYQRFTFLSVFAIPALIDILMLTTTGHGLYLSAKMSFQEQHSATVALMISLLVSGAIGTWITCGGTYYLASMAFSAMNYFVVTRLLGGFAFTLAVATVGFIAFTCQSNVSAGIVFFLYFIVLTTYLCLLAALANYQFTGSAFQSGRVVIIFCIPLLFISPVTTIFVQFHDINIYLTVLYFFITMLFVGLRRTGSRWTTWYQKISLLQDSELREWYIQRSESIYKKELEEMSDPAVLKLARQTLMRDVVAETKKMFFTKKTKDPLILKLADSFEATDFLMNWYSRYSGVPKPMNFSSAWNVQTKVALESLQKSQLGIRFHNGFIHWRQAGDEIGCTILYFIIALLDKWIMLLTGQQILGLGSSDKDLTLPIGFGLAYYLVGAVLLDFNAHKLFELAAAQGKEEAIPTDSDISAAVRIKAHKRKILYWRTLFRYLMLHVWGLAATSSMIWLFASSNPRHGGFVKHPSRPTIIFLSYVGAYTGLLWYQYTKVFCGPHALKPLLVGVSVGLPVGFILHRVAPKFPYTDIIALGSASWTVAILSLYAAKMIGQQEEHPLSKIDGEYNVYSGPGPDQGWSQPELRGLHNKLSVLPKGERLGVDPSSDFGSQVKLILEKCRYTKLPSLAARAFPEAEKLLELSGKLFDEQCITVELVSVDHFAKYDRAMRAVSSSMNGVVKLLVGCETKGVSANQDPLPAIYQDVGELLIQVTAQSFLGFSSRDAVLAQNLWASDDVLDCTSSTPSILERRLRASAKAGTTSTLIDHMRKQFLQDLCLGFDCDIDWENLPEDIRQYLISRCLGTPSTLADNQIAYLTERLKLSVGLNFETYLARCDYAAFTGALALSRASSWAGGNESQRAHQSLRHAKSIIDLLGSTKAPAQPSFKDRLILYSGLVYHGAGTICKFFCVAFVADPEYQRELQWTFGRGPKILQTLSRVFFNGIWMVAKSFQMMFLPVFMFKDREHVKTLWKNIQGVEVSFKRSRIIIRSLDGIYTGFIHTVDRETFKLQQYRGNHKSEPVNNTDLCYVNMYSKNMALLRRIELNKGNTINDYVYEYRVPNTSQAARLSKADLLTSPITRKGIAGQDHLQDVNYNYKGQIDSGSYLKDGNIVRFQYHYQKGAKLDGALIRAEFVLPHLSCTVSWCAAPRRRAENLDNWIPHSQVTEATFVVGADVWESKYFYDHKFHPTIVTTLNGQRVDTPPLILYDHLNVLRKPRKISFVDDNPLYSFSSIHSNPLTRWLGFYTRRYPVSTSQARSWLWKAWKEEVGCDGVIVRWLDERLLRRDPVLRPYWRHRDFGDLSAAEDFLDQNRDAVMASVDLDNTISSWTPLAMKINDLYSFGQGGDACSRTRSNVTTQEDDDETALHVIAVDTGTWPNEGGGVSACRSDVINNLRTIKWHMVAESANDFGIPKRQIERNVHSLKVIPLWGLDLLTPTHGLFANRLDSEVDHITTHATLQDIERSFVPILAALISGARALDFSKCDVKQVTRALVNLNAYFKESRHWSEVWRSDVVKNAWRRIWLSQTSANARPSSAWLRTELPTLGQLDQGLELWSRYLFIFSIPIPEKMPAVFQASHHSVSASYGIVCKIKRGCTLQIWDHAISWRETNLYLSSALCPLSPFVRNSLLGLMRMTSILTLHHADTILPCADFFNPNWEVEIGTCQGKIEHRNAFKRKIDPVVNGITEMNRFSPVKEIKTKTPTVTMLSHVWYAKDIKTALLAADIIINQWGFKEYRLDIYGALDKSPAYTTNCQEIIATKSLRHNVALKGEANPIHVLEQTWVFLNSSISEGLPLALGEAALTGAPVVCTDVGASLRVLTNPVDGTCYSAVVAPNDALAMARAQIKMLALLDEFAQYADPEPSISSSSSSDPAIQTSLPENPTQEDVERITKRMYTQTPARRRLGMKAREIVQKSFSGERYLREHEQMLWIGKARKDMTKPTNSRPTTHLPSPKPIFLSNLISAKTYRESGVGNPPRADRGSRDRERDSEMAISASTVRETLPSLAFANSLPSQSIKSDFVSTVGMGRVVGGDWIRSAEGKGVGGGAQVRVVELGVGEKGGLGGSPLRRDRRIVGGVSVSSSVAGEMV